MRPGVVSLICLPLLATLADCGSTEPYARTGEWRPLGANADNLRAMVADPHDLLSGHGAASSDGELAALAVARLRADQVRPLPYSAVTDIKVNDAGNGAPAPAAGASPPAAAATPADAGSTQ